jgi:hypothetical protein
VSELGRAVAEKLKGAVPEVEVEAILRESRVTASAAVPTPVRLRVLEVAFSGVKRLKRPDSDGDGADEARVDQAGADVAGAGASVVTEPFEFT